MITALIATVFFTLPPIDPGTPTPPPPLPTQVTQGDGTRLTCTPTYSYCWRDSQ